MTVPRPPVRPAPRPAVSAPHSRLRLAGTLASVGVRTTLLPRPASRRGRASVCDAARILTAAGVRVRVVPSRVPWPRTGGRLVVNGSVGRIDQLAVLTAVPRSVRGWAELAERALGVRHIAVVLEATDVLLPVAVRYRREGDDSWLTGDEVPRDLTAALARRDLVVEVHLLPALRPSDC